MIFLILFEKSIWLSKKIRIIQKQSLFTTSPKKGFYCEAFVTSCGRADYCGYLQKSARALCVSTPRTHHRKSCSRAGWDQKANCQQVLGNKYARTDFVWVSFLSQLGWYESFPRTTLEGVSTTGSIEISCVNDPSPLKSPKDVLRVLFILRYCSFMIYRWLFLKRNVSLPRKQIKSVFS